MKLVFESKRKRNPKPLGQALFRTRHKRNKPSEKPYGKRNEKT